MKNCEALLMTALVHTKDILFQWPVYNLLRKARAFGNLDRWRKVLLLLLNDLHVYCITDQISCAVQAELLHDPCPVGLNGLLGDQELLSNMFAGHAACNVTEDLPFSGSEMI